MWTTCERCGREHSRPEGCGCILAVDVGGRPDTKVSRIVASAGGSIELRGDLAELLDRILWGRDDPDEVVLADLTEMGIDVGEAVERFERHLAKLRQLPRGRPPGRYRDVDGVVGTLSVWDPFAFCQYFEPDGAKHVAAIGPGIRSPTRRLGQHKVKRLVPVDDASDPSP